MSTLTPNLNPYPNVRLSIPALTRNAAGKGVNSPTIVRRQLDQRDARTSNYLGNIYTGVVALLDRRLYLRGWEAGHWWHQNSF